MLVLVSRLISPFCFHLSDLNVAVRPDTILPLLSQNISSGISTDLAKPNVAFVLCDFAS